MTAALLVVAMQVSLIEDETPNADELMPVVVGLVEKARSEGAPVVWVADQSVAPDPAIHPVFRPKPGEAILKPPSCDAFHEDRLAGTLGGRGVTRLVVCGMRSEYCIDRTVRAAPGYGFSVTLVADGHTTITPEKHGFRKVIADVNESLGALEDVKVVSSEDVHFF